MKLSPGDPAPAFSGITTEGEPLSLSDFAGKKLVLYFYPKDDTPGCTKQACSLRDGNQAIAAKGAAVVGVSTQDRPSHQHFTHKYHLNFPLLADPDGAICTQYGTMGGGITGAALKLLGLSKRITFIIDEHGIIRHILDDPNCDNHAEEVLKYL